MNQINFIVGVQDMNMDAAYSCMVSAAISTSTIIIDLGYDILTTSSTIVGNSYSSPTGTQLKLTSELLGQCPAVGLHYVAMLENTSGATITFYGTIYGSLKVQLSY